MEGGGTTVAGSGGCLAGVCVECDVPFTGGVAFSSVRRPRERKEVPCDESVEPLGIPLLRDPLRRTPLEPPTRGKDIFLSEEDDCPRPELPDPVLVSVRLGRDLVVRQLAAQFVSPLTRLKFAFVSYLRHNNTSNFQRKLWGKL